MIKTIFLPTGLSVSTQFERVRSRLIEPHPTIIGIGARRRVRLLASLLFLLIPLVSTSIWANSHISIQVIYFESCVLVAIICAYGLSRTRYYNAAAIIGLAALSITPPGILLARTFTPLNLYQAFTWSLIPLLLGMALLSFRGMAFFAAVNLLSPLILVFLIPELDLFGAAPIISLLFVLSILLLTIMRHLSLIEQERVDELASRSEALSKLNQELASEVCERTEAELALSAANEQLAHAYDQLESLVEQRTAKLAQANRDHQTLLYVISHDLKEPLRAIENFSNMVRRRYADQLDDKGQDFLRRVIRAAVRLNTLIDDILTLSRAQQLEIPDCKISSQEIVLEILARLEIQVQESKAQITVSPGLPDLQINRTWATQAIYNLISNALKYTQEGVAPEIEITPYRGPKGIGLSVKDRGLGISEEESERIFKLFQRAVGREIEGTGAGLAIVRQIAERHGGDAWAVPRTDGGTEFVITFSPPLKPA